MKSTVYCYDRYATHKRVAAALLTLVGVGAALAIGKPAEAESARIERLPTVVIVGKSARPVQLPTVVVVGRRQPVAVMAAEEKPQVAEMKRVAFVPTAATY